MIKRLEELSLGQRIALTVVIVLVILFAFALFGFLTGRWDEAEGQPLVLTLPPSKWDAEIIELDKQAVNEAYVAKIKQLFDVYVREGVEVHERPVKGAAQARRAYIVIRQAIEKREELLNAPGRD